MSDRNFWWRVFNESVTDCYPMSESDAIALSNAQHPCFPGEYRLLWALGYESLSLEEVGRRQDKKDYRRSARNKG